MQKVKLAAVVSHVTVRAVKIDIKIPRCFLRADFLERVLQCIRRELVSLPRFVFEKELLKALYLVLKILRSASVLL